MSKYATPCVNPAYDELSETEVSKLPSGKGLRGGWFYILHCETTIGGHHHPNAPIQHYCGSCKCPKIRYLRHLRGRGGRVPNVWNHKGLKYTMEYLRFFASLDDARAYEMWYKKSVKNCKRHCPICKPEQDIQRAKRKAERAAERKVKS